MQIKCPFCGKRDHSEFTYMGDATIVRPDHQEQDQAAWFHYVFERDNPKGEHDELWHHTSGCRQFVKVTRHMVTHKISDQTLLGGEKE